MATESVHYGCLPGFTGFKVGTDGSVWTRWEKVSAGRGKGSRRVLTKVWRKLVCKSGRYPRLTLRGDNGREATFKVARLVLLVFVGPCPNGMEACHYPDRDPWNSRLDNLRWGTKKDNWRDRIAHGNGIEGVKNPKTKLTEDEVRWARKLNKAGYGYRRIASLLGLASKSTVQALCTGKSWKTVV